MLNKDLHPCLQLTLPQTDRQGNLIKIYLNKIALLSEDPVKVKQAVICRLVSA